MIDIFHSTKVKEKMFLKKNDIQEQRLEYNHNLMIFKFRNVATMSTSNQHNLNIGISRCVLYRRTQKTGTLGKGAKKHNRRKKDQDLKTSWRYQPAPPLRDTRMRAVG